MNEEARPYVRRVRPKVRKILDAVNSGLNDLANHTPVAEPILNIYGISGIGKTYLLWEIFDECKSKYHVIWIGFRADGPDHAQESTWIDVIGRLRNLPELENLPDVLLSDKQETIRPETEQVMFSSNRPLDGDDDRPLLLLLDGLDGIRYWKWLQSEIIKPLIEYGRALIVCTSQAQLFWNFWELRERQQIHEELPSFDLAETTALFRRHRREPLANIVHELMRGYPLALTQFINLLNTTQDEAINGGLDQILSSDERSNIHKALRLAAVMRRIDQPTLTKLFEKLYGESLSLPETLKVLSVFQQAGCVKSYSQAYGQADGLIRRSTLRRKAVKLLESELSYPRVCQALADIYYESVVQSGSSHANQGFRRPKEQVDAFIEWLYFSTEALDTNPSEAQSGTWRDRWSKQFGKLEHAMQGTGMLLAWQFYRDSELLEKLDELGLLDTLHDFMRACIGQGQSREPLWEAADIKPLLLTADTSCDEVMNHLSQRIPTNELSPQMRKFLAPTSLRAIFSSKYFDVGKLHEVIKGKPGPLPESPTEARALLSTLKSSGLLSYDRERRSYQTNDLLRELAKV